MSIRLRHLRSLVLLAVGLVVGLAGGATPARAGEPAIRYPVTLHTMPGRIYEWKDMRHELGEEGSFTFYDQNEEGKVAWRDIDKIVFTGNIGYGPGSEGRDVPRTHRVRIHYLDGSERVVNLVIGRLMGDDGAVRRNIQPRDIAVLDFQQSEIAPFLYKVCDRGHQWEQRDFRFCPYDAQPLKEVTVSPTR